MKNLESESRYSQWKALIEEQAQSGLTRKEFCQQKSLVLSQFIYYFTKLKTKKIKENSEPALMVPIYLKNQNQTLTKGEIKITLPNSLNLCLVYEDELQFKNLIGVLKSC